MNLYSLFVRREEKIWLLGFCHCTDKTPKNWRRAQKLTVQLMAAGWRCNPLPRWAFELRKNQFQIQLQMRIQIQIHPTIRNTCCWGKPFPRLCLYRWDRNNRRTPLFWLWYNLIVTKRVNFSTLQEDPGDQAHRLLPPPWSGSWWQKWRGWICVRTFYKF